MHVLPTAYSYGEAGLLYRPGVLQLHTEMLCPHRPENREDKKNAKHNGIFGMNIYHVPITPILAMILLVGLLQIVLSLVLSSNLKKETLVERIRYQG